MSGRIDRRRPDQLREVRITRNWLDHAEGSVLVEFGKTRVLIAASVTEGVPRWRKGSGLGWVTSEYAMLPRATHDRNDRESVRGRIGGRTHEISRLIGRSLRAVIDYKALGENTIVLDCDVLQADGGTRTASITGAYVALADAVEWLRKRGALAGEPLLGTVSAVSVGVVDGVPMLDLCYEEDSTADTDLNVVVAGDGRFVEIQGTAERDPFDRETLNQLLDLGVAGCAQLRHLQLQALSGPRAVADGATRVVLATGNAHKLDELRRTFAEENLAVEVLGLGDVASYESPEETERTFEGNALIKARAAAAHTGLPALADDSGLMVGELGGSPGIRSARWAGGEGDVANLELVLKQLHGVPDDRRDARFVCAMALVLPDGTERTLRREWPGRLTTAPRGTNGFGYDPIFVPDGETRTSAELAPEEKDAISHRGQAVRAMVPVLRDLLG